MWSWTKTITGLSISAQLQDFCLGPNLLRFDLCQNILRYVLHQVMPAVRSAFKTWSVSCDSSMLQFVLYACFIKSWEKHFVSSWKRKLRVCSAGQSSGLSHDAFDVVQPCQKMQVLVGTTWRVSTASASQGEFFLWSALCLECFNLGGGVYADVLSEATPKRHTLWSNDFHLLQRLHWTAGYMSKSDMQNLTDGQVASIA